jgi:hypothetical protein
MRRDGTYMVWHAAVVVLRVTFTDLQRALASGSSSLLCLPEALPSTTIVIYYYFAGISTSWHFSSTLLPPVPLPHNLLLVRDSSSLEIRY